MMVMQVMRTRLHASPCARTASASHAYFRFRILPIQGKSCAQHTVQLLMDKVE
jgi:hypothetical protein